MAKATSHICEVERELGAVKAQHVQVRAREEELAGGVGWWGRVEEGWDALADVDACLQYLSENESSLQQVRAMLANTQKDKVELANQLEEEKRYDTPTNPPHPPPTEPSNWSQCFVPFLLCLNEQIV